MDTCGEENQNVMPNAPAELPNNPDNDDLPRCDVQTPSQAQVELFTGWDIHDLGVDIYTPPVSPVSPAPVDVLTAPPKCIDDENTGICDCFETVNVNVDVNVNVNVNELGVPNEPRVNECVDNVPDVNVEMREDFVSKDDDLPVCCVLDESVDACKDSLCVRVGMDGVLKDSLRVDIDISEDSVCKAGNNAEALPCLDIFNVRYNHDRNTDNANAHDTDNAHDNDSVQKSHFGVITSRRPLTRKTANVDDCETCWTMPPRKRLSVAVVDNPIIANRAQKTKSSNVGRRCKKSHKQRGNGKTNFISRKTCTIL